MVKKKRPLTTNHPNKQVWSMRQHSLSFMTWNIIPRNAIVVCAIVIHSPQTLVADQPTQSRVALQLKSLGSIAGSERWDWWQARTAYIPGSEPRWITTMSETGKTTSHDFHDIFQSVSYDRGKTWSAAQVVPSLQRRKEEDSYQVAAGDLTYQQNPAFQLRLAE